MNRLALMFVALLVAWSGAEGADADLERLAAARATWLAQGADSYRYAYEKYCECYRNEQPKTFVTVAAGRVERVYHLHENSDREVPAREGSLDLYWTIDDLFAKLETALNSEAGVRVEYDTNYGYPVTLFIDYDRGFVGDETDIRLTLFEPL